MSSESGIEEGQVSYRSTINVLHSLRDVAENATQSKRRADDASQRIQEMHAQEQTTTRPYLAKAAIIVYGIAIVVTILAMVITAYSLEDSPRQELHRALTDILKSALLPLVTLILGFYFGSSSSK